MDDFGLAGKLFLPIAIVTAAVLMPSPEPAPIVVEVAEWLEMPAPVVTVEAPALSPSVVNVAPAQPVVTEKVVELEGETVTVYKDRVVETIVEVPVEVRTCLVWSELPSWDLAKAITVTRPGEAWSLSGDYYPGLVWHADTPKPSESELIAGWLADLEAETC